MLIYLGNQLTASGKNPTGVDTLGEQLKEIMPIIQASNKKNVFPRLLHMWWVLWYYRKRARIVIIDTYSTLNFYYAVTSGFWCQLWGLPYITLLRGGNLPHRFVTSPKLSRYLFKNAYRIISPSAYLAEVFEKRGYTVGIISNNIEIKRYPFKERRNVKPRLLYVRALQKIYNPGMAIKVLAKVRSLLGAGELCFVGPDKDNSLAELKILAQELGVASNVRFTGKLTKEEWINLSVNYDIFINPTHFDNMPVSVIEAMALGLPVISTNVGGLPFIIADGKNGLLVNDDDTDAMVESVIKLYNQPLLAGDISKNARAYVEQFDWTLIKEKWLPVLTGANRK